jgi:hypothetical protein
VEEQVVVICLEAGKHTPFKDNKTGHCAVCGKGVVWRPQVPEPSIKLCTKCGLEEVEDATKRGDVEVGIYPGQREELEEHLGPVGVRQVLKMLEALRKGRK